jgi:hypothetical protein
VFPPESDQLRSTIIVFQCIPCHAVSKWRRRTGHQASLSAMHTVSDRFPQPNGYEFRRCFTEDRGEGVEKSGGFRQEFVKEASFRKGITFYTFLIKRAGFAQGLFPTICVSGARWDWCGSGTEEAARFV